MEDKILEAARKLVANCIENEPAITEALLFPNDHEIRIVYVDRTNNSSDGKITAYRFPPEDEEGIPFPSAIALILPEEKEKVALPEEWGEWSNALLIYKQSPEKDFIDFMGHLHDIAIDLSNTLNFDKHNERHLRLILLYASMIEYFGSAQILIRSKAFIGVTTLLRSAAEAYADFFNLIKDKEYLNNMQLVELKAERKVLEESTKDPYASKKLKESGIDLANKLQVNTEKIATLNKLGYKEPLKIKEKFEKAGNIDIYHQIYNLLCSDTHNDNNALLMRHIHKSNDNKTFDITFYAPPDISWLILNINLFCQIIMLSTEIIHKNFYSPAMDKIDKLRIELTECMNKVGLTKEQ